jgi:hypothetical protein
MSAECRVQSAEWKPDRASPELARFRAQLTAPFILHSALCILQSAFCTLHLNWRNARAGHSKHR